MLRKLKEFKSNDHTFKAVVLGDVANNDYRVRFYYFAAAKWFRQFENWTNDGAKGCDSVHSTREDAETKAKRWLVIVG